MTVQRIHCSKKLISQWFHPAYSHQLLSTSVFHLSGFWSTQACFNATRDCGSRFPVTYLHNRSAFQARDLSRRWAKPLSYFSMLFYIYAFQELRKVMKTGFGTDSPHYTERISDKICQFRLKGMVHLQMNILSFITFMPFQTMLWYFFPCGTWRRNFRTPDIVSLSNSK